MAGAILFNALQPPDGWSVEVRLLSQSASRARRQEAGLEAREVEDRQSRFTSAVVS